MTELKSMGTISTSNVNNPNSECITLTYTITGLEKLAALARLGVELDELHNEQSTIDVEIKDYGGGDFALKMKYKIKTCQDEKLAHNIKANLDKFLKRRGGQTTLDVLLKETE